MKKSTYIIIATLLFGIAVSIYFATSRPPIIGIVYEGGDGSSMKNAVVIRGTLNSGEGIRAEYDWINKMHPGWVNRRQSLRSDKKGNYYDVITYSTPQGNRTVYFNITDFCLRR